MPDHNSSLAFFTFFLGTEFSFLFLPQPMHMIWYLGPLVTVFVASLRALQLANPVWAYTVALSECSVVIWVAVSRSFLGRVQWPADLLLNPEELD
jgi:hypothetical protein